MRLLIAGLLLVPSVLLAQPEAYTDPSPSSDRIAGCSWKFNTKKVDVPSSSDSWDGTCRYDLGTLTAGSKVINVSYYYFEDGVRKETGPSNTIGVTRTNYVGYTRWITGKVVECKPECKEKY